jgi:isopenicillin-N epimerase
MKDLWYLDPEITFLNHGSFGATPRAVIEKQNEWRLRMEREPVLFLARELDGLLDSARNDIARFVGAMPDDIAFVTNATAAVNAVLRAQRFAPGDELIVTTHEYNASRNILEFVASRSGANVIVVDVPFPIESADVVLDRVLNSVNAKTRLVLIDHVTSQTALIFPIERLVAELHARGVEVLVDGAHAPGMLPLDLTALGASYYTGNLHKWVCAPKGAAFLYVREDRRARVRPVAISHGANSTRTDRSRFHLEFDWTGTFDPTAWLCAGESIRYLASLVPGGWNEIMKRNRDLAIRARDILSQSLEIPPPAPDAMLGSMAALPLPDGDATTAPSLYGDPLQDVLFATHRIEVPVVPWPKPPRRVLRVSAHLYNTTEEYERLANAVGAEIRLSA